MNTTNLTPELQLAIGIALAISALCIAFALSRRGSVKVLAHRGFFVLPEADNTEKEAPPAGPHWFVKIINHTGDPVVITHVGFKHEAVYVPCLGRKLPARIEPGGVIETWVGEGEIDPKGGIISSEVIARSFEAADTIGRRHGSRMNRHVAPSGFVA